MCNSLSYSQASGQQPGPKGALLAAEEEKRALLAERLALDQQFAGMCSLERHQQEMQATLATAGLAEEPAEASWWWRLPQALLGGTRPQPAPAALPPAESSGAAYIDPSATHPPSGAGFVVWFKRHFKQAFINLLLRGAVTPSDAEFRQAPPRQPRLQAEAACGAGGLSVPELACLRAGNIL